MGSLAGKSASWRSFPDIQRRDTGFEDDGRDDVRVLFIPGFIHFLTRVKSELTFSHGPYLNHDLRERSDAIRNELETLCHHDSGFFPLQVCGQILQLYDSRHFYHKNIFDGPILADIATELAKSLEVDGANEIGNNVATWLRDLHDHKSIHEVDINAVHSKTAYAIGLRCSALAEQVEVANLCNLVMVAHDTAFLHEDIFKMEGTFLSTIVNIIVLNKMYGQNQHIRNWHYHKVVPTSGSMKFPTPSPEKYAHHPLEKKEQNKHPPKGKSQRGETEQSEKEKEKERREKEEREREEREREEREREERGESEREAREAREREAEREKKEREKEAREEARAEEERKKERQRTAEQDKTKAAKEKAAKEKAAKEKAAKEKA